MPSWDVSELETIAVGLTTIAPTLRCAVWSSLRTFISGVCDKFAFQTLFRRDRDETYRTLTSQPRPPFETMNIWFLDHGASYWHSTLAGIAYRLAFVEGQLPDQQAKHQPCSLCP